MAAARSTLLEGLEGMSEEEQLRRVLELSEKEAGALEARANPATGCSFESWVSTPAEERLRALGQSGAGGEIYYSDNEDEEMRRVMEESKRNVFMTEEEATRLAIEASEKEAETGRPSSVANIDKELESAIQLSMNEFDSMNEWNIEGERMRHNSIADSEPQPQGACALASSPPDRQRSRSPDHVTVSTGGKSKSRPASPAETSFPRRQRHRSSTESADIRLDDAARQPLNITIKKTPSFPGPCGTAFPTLSEEQQLEMALKQSEEQTVMSEDDQLKLALRLSQSESGGFGASVPIIKPDPVGGSINTISQPPPPFDPFHLPQPQRRPPAPSSGSGDTRHLGARSRVPNHRARPQRPIRDVSSSSSNSSSNPGTLERHSLPSSTDTSQDNLRMIVLDGCNIMKKVGKGDDFVIEALEIVYNWFSTRGHDVVIIVPQSVKSKLMGAQRWADVEKLNNFEKANILYYSPSKKTDERSWDCYDDRYIVEFAARKKAIVVTTDNYRDVLKENNPDFNEQIRER